MIYYTEYSTVVAVFRNGVWNEENEAMEGYYNYEGDFQDRGSTYDKWVDDEKDRIVLTDNYTYFEPDALRFVPEIKVVQVTKEFDDLGVFWKCPQLERVIVPNDCEIPVEAFYYCNHIKCVGREDGTRIDPPEVLDSCGMEFEIGNYHYSVNEQGVSLSWVERPVVVSETQIETQEPEKSQITKPQKLKRKSLLEKFLPVVYYAKNSTLPEEE